MPENSTRADYAKSILMRAYDTVECGVGIQKQLVNALVFNPAQISNVRYLNRALNAGIASDLTAAIRNHGEHVFSRGYVANVENDLQQLKYKWQDLDAFVFKALAKGADYAHDNRFKLKLHEAVEMFNALADNGYFSRHPSRHAVEKYLMYGRVGFGAVLGRENVDVDFDRFDRDMQAVMLGDARKECVSFHANKLKVMAWITELTNSTLTGELGAYGYKAWLKGLTQDAKLSASWKELFDESVPAPDALISSSRKTVEEAEKFVNPDVHRGYDP